MLLGALMMLQAGFGRKYVPTAIACKLVGRIALFLFPSHVPNPTPHILYAFLLVKFHLLTL
jgi:hypothetical protein